MAGVLTLAGAAVVPASSALASSPRVGARAPHPGARGAGVRALQHDLTKAGFPTKASGVFGSQTTRSVRSFQRRYELDVTGVADASFVRDLRQVMRLDVKGVDAGAAAVHADAVSGGGGLGSSTSPTKARKFRKSKHSKKAHVSADPTAALNNPVLAPVVQDGGSKHLGERTLRKGMTGHDVRVLQSYLTLAGFPTGIDGEFGGHTRVNVVRFERANNLKTNGVLTYSQSRVLRQDVAKAVTASGSPRDSGSSGDPGTPAPGGRATLNSDGTVTAPAGAPQAVQDAIAAANSIIDTPYIYGGGHGKFNDSGYDCSGAVSFALHGGGLLSSPEDSTQLERYGSPGPGKWITVYADAGHAFVVIAGLAFDTAHYGPTTPAGSGPRWLTAANSTANLRDHGNYIVRHPSGF